MAFPPSGHYAACPTRAATRLGLGRYVTRSGPLQEGYSSVHGLSAWAATQLVSGGLRGSQRAATRRRSQRAALTSGPLCGGPQTTTSHESRTVTSAVRETWEQRNRSPSYRFCNLVAGRYAAHSRPLRGTCTSWFGGVVCSDGRVVFSNAATPAEGPALWIVHPLHHMHHIPNIPCILTPAFSISFDCLFPIVT